MQLDNPGPVIFYHYIIPGGWEGRSGLSVIGIQNHAQCLLYSFFYISLTPFSNFIIPFLSLRSPPCRTPYDQNLSSLPSHSFAPVMPPPNSNERHQRQRSGSITQPWISQEADSSNPETLHEIPLGEPSAGLSDYNPRVSESTSKLPRGSVDSNPRTSGTAARLAELRAEMKANQEQIQQLTDAHKAVQNAVSGINATQELLHFAPGKMAQSDIPQRNASVKTTASRFSQAQSMSDKPSQPMSQPPGMDRQGWVDDDYYESNPWYGQSKDKPVFSLGRPLPHTSRFGSKKKDKEQKGKGPQDDPEKGQVSAMKKKPSQGKRVQIAEGSDDQASQGMLEGNKTSPWDVDFKVPDLTTGPNPSEKAPGYEEGSKYKVDGEPVGQKEDDEAERGPAHPDDLRNWWARFRAKYPEPLAEFACTTMSVFLGMCATLSVNLSSSQENKYGDYETACWAWGFALMFGIYIGGGVSGAHMNPAISISLSIFRGFPWKQCGVYIVVQFLAAITAAAMAYGIYYDAIHYVDPNMESSWKSFYSYPQDWVTIPTAIMSQFVAGAVMMVAVFSLGDDQNNPPGAGMHAFVLGLLTVTLKFCLGYNTGSALNPASDFGPRLVALWVGYRTPTTFENAWWVYGPWGAALAGSIAGCVLYDLLIFVGSESPVNYRIPKAFRRRTNQLKDLTRKF
ncbi:aquaporin-like protein [Xylariomycetidae sp. FL2044]|nr:aquaporin-like protein [Xylariomycetidae sp. FL2044]